MKWINIEETKPPHTQAIALSRYGEYEAGRHIQTWISDGVNVWVGRINFGSETVDGYEDENGLFCTHWMDLNRPKPCEYIKQNVERDAYGVEDD